MSRKPSVVVSVVVAAMFCSLAGPSSAAGPGSTTTNPDFTRGDKIPEGANHDWNLGATGARGWMYSDKLVTSDARQITITKVEKDSPADGVLAVGDVILGVGGKPFSYDPRTELGKALTTAESEAGGGNLSLIRWRAGKTENVVVKLPVLGTYSATAPYDCPKSKRILEQGCKALARRIADPSYRQNPITRSLNALALLASGKPEYLPLVKKEAQWAADYSADSFQTWYYGYVIMLLSEYVMETGDESVMPGLRRLALEAAQRAEHRRFVGPPLRESRWASGRLRDDERPGLAADDWARPGTRGGGRRSGSGAGDRTKRAADAVLHRQGRRSLRRSPSVDPDPRGQRQVRHGGRPV